MGIEGIYDIDSRILTFEDGKAFKVIDETIDSLDMEQRLSRLTAWARKNSYITQSSVIAEI